jgi:hypothetical protein
MPLNPDRRIYYYEWRGEQTGWDYRLKIFKASETKFNAPGDAIEIVRLPAGCINPKKLEMKYRQYPWGAPEVPPKFLFEIFMDEIDLGANYDEFWDMIYDPVVPIATGFLSFYMDAGTCYELWVKFNGFTLPLTDEGYRLIYVGVCRNTFQWLKKTNSEATLIETEDINKVMTDNTDTFYWGIDTVNRVAAGGVLEYAIIGDDNYVIGHQKDDCSMYMRQLSFIDTLYRTWAEKCYRAQRRNSTLTYNYTPPTFKAYRQLYDSTGGLGTEVAYQDLYVISDVIEGGEDKGGLLNTKGANSIYNRYPNGAWDYIDEYYQQFWYRAILRPTGYFGLPIFGMNSLSTIIPVSVDKRLQVKFPVEQLSVKTATASLYESFSDDYTDINKWEAVDRGSRNQGEVTIPIVLNNMPAAVKYSENMLVLSTLLNLVKPVLFRKAWKPHVLGLYYLETNASLVDSPGVFIRAHEFIEYKVNNTTYSGNVPGCVFAAYDPLLAHTINQPSEICRDMQSFGCAPKYASVGLLELLKHKKLFTCEITADFDDYVGFDANDMPGFLWMNPDVLISFDANTVMTRANLPSENWLMTSYELDFDTETARNEYMLEGWYAS